MPPFMLLQTLCLGLLTFLLIVAAPLRELGETTETARTQFAVATGQTQGTLTTLARALADDSAFSSHLRWQMHNSASTLASGQLRLGEIDEVQILGAKCQRYLRATLKSQIKFDCEQSGILDQQQDKDRFFWVDDAGVPLLGVALRLRKLDRPTTLVALVRLDHDWLALHPGLADYSRRLQLRLVPSTEQLKQHTIIASTNQSSKNAGASLITDKYLLSWLPASLLKTDLSSSPALWLLLLITAALTLSIWSRAHVVLKQSTDRFDEFLTWCRQVRLYAKDMAIGQQPQPMPKPNLRGQLANAQTELLAAINEMNDGLLLQQREITAGENRIIQLQQQIQAAHLETANIARLKSLAMQTESFAKILQADIVDFRERLQDLNDITSHGMHPEAQKIAALIGDWQQQITARGARKFIRSLAETNVTPTYTLLDQQLDFLRVTASHLLDALLAMSQQRGQLHERLQDLQAITTFWAHFDAAGDDEVVKNLPQAISNAQRLATMQLKSLTHIRFENQLESSSLPQMPLMPDSALVSSLFHLYVSAVHRLVDGSDTNASVTLTTQVRLGRDQHMLIISAITNTGKTAGGNTEVASQHLGQVRTIAAGYGLQARILPLVGNCQPYALSWDISPDYQHTVPVSPLTM